MPSKLQNLLPVITLSFNCFALCAVIVNSEFRSIWNPITGQVPDCWQTDYNYCNDGTYDRGGRRIQNPWTSRFFVREQNPLTHEILAAMTACTEAGRIYHDGQCVDRPPCADVTSGMLRLYRGDEGEGQQVHDYASERDAHFEGSVQWQNQDLYGESRAVLYFPGGGQVKTSADGLPGGRSPRTIMGWFKPQWQSGDHPSNGPFGYGTSGCNNAYYAYINGATLNLDQWCQDERVNPIISSLQERWYFVAISYDGNENTAYVDGQRTGSGVPDAPPGTQLTN
eukprot:SAG31_NODE_12804_length_915_cov_1.337010_1_plen_281_part_10